MLQASWVQDVHSLKATVLGEWDCAFPYALSTLGGLALCAQLAVRGNLQNGIKKVVPKEVFADSPKTKDNRWER